MLHPPKPLPGTLSHHLPASHTFLRGKAANLNLCACDTLPAYLTRTAAGAPPAHPPAYDFLRLTGPSPVRPTRPPALRCAATCRALLPKTLVSEVREAADRRKQDASALRALSLAFRYEAASATAQPADLSYDYLDKQIFDDSYRVLRTAIDESLGVGHREMVLELYLSLVEPFFGLPVRERWGLLHHTGAELGRRTRGCLGMCAPLPDAQAPSPRQKAPNA